MTEAQSASRAAFASPTSIQNGEGAKPTRATAPRSKKSSNGPAAFFSDVRAALDARARLFRLELRRNGIYAGYIAAFAVGGALLAVIAWLLLVGAVVGGLLSAGLHWALAVIIALALQVIAIFVLLRAMRVLLGNLTFTVIRRSWSPKHLRGPNGAIS